MITVRTSVKSHLKRCAIALFLHAIIFSSTASAQLVLTLDDALETAYATSPTIRQSALSLERSQESLNAQNAALKSNFSFSVTPFGFRRNREFSALYSSWSTTENKDVSGTFRITQPLKWSDGTLSLINKLGWQDSFSDFQKVRTNKGFNNNLSLIYNQPLFSYNRTKLNLEELELDLENSSINFSIQKLALERNVTQSFFKVYELQMGLQIEEEEHRNQQKSYEIIKNKVEAGLSAKEELFQAELNLANSKSNFHRQQVQLENAKDAFKQLIGLSIFEEITTVADVSHQPVTVSLQKALEAGLAARLELRQRQIQIENAQFNLTRSSATNEFKGNLSLTVGIFGEDAKLPSVYETPTNNQDVAISFEIPLWDWGEKKSRIRASEAVLKSSEIAHEEERTSIIIAIRSAHRSLNNLINQIELARQSEKNAQLTYDINLERYANGDLTSMDLNLFQTQLSERKMGLVSALIDYRLELLNMKIQSLWDFEKDKAVLIQQ